MKVTLHGKAAIGELRGGGMSGDPPWAPTQEERVAKIVVTDAANQSAVIATTASLAVAAATTQDTILSDYASAQKRR